MKRTITLALFLALALGTAVPGYQASARQEIDPADFSPVITNPYFPLATLGPRVLEGEETNDEGEVVETRLESKVLPETKVVAGVTVTVLEERAFEDGELIEVALDYFAQQKNGDVYYFGEAVDNYEGGVIANHDGAWLAGEGGNQPGLFMRAQPSVDQTLQLEYAPGIAEDMATILSLTEAVETPADSFANCLKTRDFTPLEPGLEEFKWYCPGAGLVKEQGDDFESLLTAIEYRHTPAGTVTPPSTGSAGLR